MNGIQRGLVVLLTGGFGLAGCAGPKPDPRYRPTESVLEVVAVLRRHVPDDTYRFEPARDFTGRNVYRASLLRFESLERVHADALRAGHMDDVIAFSKGRAFERLRAYDLAASSYRLAGQDGGPLRQEALSSAAVCDALDEAVGLGASGQTAALVSQQEAELRHGRSVALLQALAADHADDHYAAVIREEVERTDVVRAQRLVSERDLQPDGDVRAVGALQRLILDHRDSKNANRHLLRLADLYADLAAEYVESQPPEGLRFDPPAFEDLVTSASRLYEAVANQDGATERLEATQRLEAFLAFTLRVDRDRFRP